MNVKNEEEEEEERKEERKNDIPGITTFLTSLLTRRTSDSNLCPFLPRWGDIFPILFILVLVMMSIVIILMVRG